MATRRRVVSRSIITTRSSSASKPKHHKPERYEHHELPTTTATLASSTITTRATTILLISTDQSPPCSPSPVVKENSGTEDEEAICCSWSTPKAKRFRIPEIESCPPAPKKLRTKSSSCSINNGDNKNYCSLRRSSISFFTPPELNEFFSRVSAASNMSTAACSLV